MYLFKLYTMKISIECGKKLGFKLCDDSSEMCFDVLDDGQNLACGLANKSAQMFSMPLSGKGSSYVGTLNFYHMFGMILAIA